jgi:AcrR family transcriptional regulator
MDVSKPPLERPTREAARQALLEAATEVFLADGFRAARVQAIAEQAGVRLSAINYHFGSKEGLYQAVLQHHADLALKFAPFPPLDAHRPLEERFKQVVHALVHRFLDPANPSRIGSLLVREAANPTGALEVMFNRYTRPQSQMIFAFLLECFGGNAQADLLARTALSVMGQVVVYVGFRPLVELFRPGFYEREEGLTELINHITTFSWAGIQALVHQERSL